MMNEKNQKNIYKEFGAFVSRRRKEKRLTCERLSELAGISDVYLRNLERGNHGATWVIWLKLCMILDVNVDDVKKNFSGRSRQ